MVSNADEVASRDEEDELGYYDFMAQLEVPYFHWGGMRATERLVSLCKITSGKEVLTVGCGTGYSACYIAKKFGCRVVGIDISEEMIGKAKERAETEGLTDRVEFYVGDAYDLPFDDNSFDVVMTEFVSIFLDKQRAFREYVRVLRSGGYVGVNELYKLEDIPQEAKELISEAEGGFEEAIGLAFVLPTPRDWEEWFRESDLEDIQLEEVDYTYSMGEYAEAVGGKAKLLKLFMKSIYHLLFNKRMRKKWMRVGKVKDVLMKNKKTKQYAGAILCVGRKRA